MSNISFSWILWTDVCCHVAMQYIAGNEFTFADLAHVPYTHYMVNMAKRGELISSRPNVAAWWERISNRPSFQEVLAMK